MKTRLLLFAVVFLLLSPFFFSTKVEALVQIETTRTFTSQTSDGYTSYSNMVYGTARNNSWGNGYPSQDHSFVGQEYDSIDYFVHRSYLYFDTSVIPSSANITEAILSLYVETNASDTDFNVTIQNGQPTYPHTPFAVGDYYHVYYSGCGGQRNTTSITGSAYWNITLNSTGIGWISRTGTTKLCLRSSRDINNTAPTTTEWISYYTAEQGSSYTPLFIVTYEYEGYEYVLYGAYDEEGLRDGAINCTLYRETEAPYNVTLDGTENVTSETLPVAFHFDLGNNMSRIYYLMDDFEEIYVFKPSEPYFIYYFTIMDFIGITNGYLETIINVNGTDRIVERWRLDVLHDIPFTLSWGVSYKIRLLCDQGTHVFGSVLAGADYEIELSVTSVDFPIDYTSFGNNVSVSATRENATWIQILYLDGANNTSWVYVNVKTQYGASAYTENNTGASQTINWYNAINTTDYIVVVTIEHNTLGTLYYSKALAAPSTMVSPFDFAFLGDLPIDPTQIFAFGITLLFAGLASTKNVGVGLFLTVIMAALFTAIGWLNITATTLTIGVALAFMVAFAMYKKRG